MKSRLFPILLLLICVGLVIEILVLKDLPMVRIGHMKFNFGGTQDGAGNWIPFKTIIPYLLGEKGLLIGGINILGNIFMLVPIGCLLPFVFHHFSWKKCWLFALFFCFSIEGLQVFYHVGIFDIDDVILNVAGVLMGYWVGIILLDSLLFSKIAGTITALTIIILILLFVYGPIGLEKAPTRELRIANTSMHTNPDSQIDPCNGTGGTGQIISTGNHYFNLKGRNGRIQKILIDENTSIQSASGPAKEADLLSGKRVTIVTNEGDVAALVLICQQK